MTNNDCRNIYTDLALEAAEQYGAGETLDGVRVETEERDVPGGVARTTRIEIHSEAGASVMGRPIGHYITVECERVRANDIDAHEAVIGLLTELLGGLEAVKDAGSVLVAGLGNWNVTPDALGPRVVSKTLVTRHLEGSLPEGLCGLTSVAVLSPGVMGLTGIETGEIIKGVVERIDPDLVIAVDALAARRANRVNATIQITDTGLVPGSGMGNARMALTRETLGKPVVAIGVPTVVDAATLVNDTMDLMLEEMAAAMPEGADFFKTLEGLGGDERHGLIKRVLNPFVGEMFVTPKEVDAVIDRLSNIIANALNITLHKGVTRDDINRYMY